jgi:carbonic anhydrase/acetyltransferase-like protein (isoleucine patch superfamily)
MKGTPAPAPKYKLLTNAEHTITLDSGVTLHRIRALRSFGTVDAGDLGGYIQHERNLSHGGNCWVHDNARVYGNARVFGNARVLGTAWVFGDAWVLGDARVHDNARVYGNARVSHDAQVLGDVYVYGTARVFGKALVSDDARVYGHARVSGWTDGKITIPDPAKSHGYVDGEPEDHTRARMILAGLKVDSGVTP